MALVYDLTVDRPKVLKTFFVDLVTPPPASPVKLAPPARPLGAPASSAPFRVLPSKSDPVVRCLFPNGWEMDLDDCEEEQKHTVTMLERDVYSFVMASTPN